MQGKTPPQAQAVADIPAAGVRKRPLPCLLPRQRLDPESFRFAVFALKPEVAVQDEMESVSGPVQALHSDRLGPVDAELERFEQQQRAGGDPVADAVDFLVGTFAKETRLLLPLPW